MKRGRWSKSLAFAAALAFGVPSSIYAQSAPPPSEPQLDLGRIHVRASGAFAETKQGSRVELTLDPELSRAAQRLLEQAHPVEGAAVVIDLKSGRLLVFSELRRSGAAGSVLTVARAPAASVFKLVTTAALYENGGVQPNDRVCISGGIRSVERRHLEVPHGPGISCSSFYQALGFSRNAAYAQLATRRLARQDLIDIGERLGFNAPLPFDWAVPMGHLEVPYNDLAFASTATGFQGSTLSPLGAAYLASIIAQGGVAQPLHLLAESPSEPALPEEAPSTPRVLSARTARRITRMMEVTTQSGTCRLIFNDENGKSLLPGIRVAGKTGTLRPDSQGETTSWFVGFAPSQKPEIAVSVLLENGPVWRQKAAQVARDLLRVYFHRKGARRVTDPFAPADEGRAVAVQ